MWLISCETWLVDMCDMSHWYVWDDSFICVTWLIYMCDMTHWYVWHDSLVCVTWLIDMCDMAHSYVWHDSLVCVTWPLISVTWLIHMCDMTHSYAWLSCVTGLIDDRCDMTHSYVWHDSFICVTRLIYMRDSHVWQDSSTTVVTWLSNITISTARHRPWCRRGDTLSATHDPFIVWHDAFLCDSFTCRNMSWTTISRLLKIIGLFCRISSLLF